MQQALTQLRRELAESAADYRVDARDDQQWRIRFIGPFQGREVVWHGHIRTLHDLACSMASDAGQGSPVRLRQFIDISEQSDGYRLQVGLNLPVLDEAAILRTIIMIRKYKRLHVGRHEYGEWIEFPSPEC